MSRSHAVMCDELTDMAAAPEQGRKAGVFLVFLLTRSNMENQYMTASASSGWSRFSTYWIEL